MLKLYPILETSTKQLVSPLWRSLSAPCGKHNGKRHASLVTALVSNPELKRLDKTAPSISSFKWILLLSLHDRITKVHRSRSQITFRLRHVQLRLTAERLLKHTQNWRTSHTSHTEGDLHGNRMCASFLASAAT